MMSQKTKSTIMIQKLNQLLTCHDIQKVLNLGRPLFGNPIILSSISYTVMAITKEPEIKERRWLDIVQTGGLPISGVTNVKINEAYRLSAEQQRPVIDNSVGDPDSPPMLRKTLCAGEKILGYLDSPAYFKEIAEEEIEIFDFLGNLLTVELMRDVDRAVVPDNMLDYFIFDLLEGKLKDQKLIQERFEYFKWNIRSKGKIQIVHIREREAGEIPDNARFRKLMELFSSTFPMSKMFVYGSELKMICSIRESLRLDERFCSDLSRLLEQQHLIAGISRPLLDITTFSEFNCQAVKAAQLGSWLKPDQKIHYYDDYAIYHALELAAKHENLMQFCHSAIVLLRDYDLEHDTELLESLRVYLTHNRSIGESAAALYIHRNTMNYRMAKINELTCMDLNEPDVYCHLLFSFYTLDYRSMMAD